MTIDAYEFKVRPPKEAGDVAYSEDVRAEIGRLSTAGNESLAQMHARNFGRSAVIDMSIEIGEEDLVAVPSIVAPLAESWSPALRAFYRSGVNDAIETFTGDQERTAA